jgi:translation initiation factor 2 gamma subunit (eIF-2gamma)
MYELRVGVYGPVDVGKSALVSKLTEFKNKGSIERDQQITVYVSCNDRVYHGDTAENIQLYDQTNAGHSIKNAWRLVSLDNPGHTKVICNSLSTLSFVNTPLLLLNSDSFETTLHIKYLDILQAHGFNKILIVIGKVDLLKPKDVEVLTQKIVETMKKYSLEYEICHYSVYSVKAMSNILEHIRRIGLQQSNSVKWLNGYFPVLKSFDPNKPGPITLSENGIIKVKEERFKGALVGGINYGIELLPLEQYYIGPIYLDLYTQTLKKEKITTIKPKILNCFKNILLPPNIQTGETGTIELSCSAGIASSDSLAGSILSTQKLSEYTTIFIKVQKSYGVLNTKDKVLLNILNLKLIGSIDAVEKKSVIKIRLLKPLPIQYKGVVIIHRNKQTTGSSSKLEIYAIGEVINYVVD